jgi:hypothetical protein
MTISGEQLMHIRTIHHPSVRAGKSHANALQILNRALQSCIDHKGVTIHVDTGVQPGTGFGVSTHKDRERILSDMPTGGDLLNYVMDNYDLLAKPDRYLGVWEDEGEWYLDVTQVILGQLAAQAAAATHNQKAVWSFDMHRSLEV